MRYIIKKILKEEFEDFEWVNDIPELSEVEKFIYDKLSECELIESKNRPGWTKYVDKNGNFLFLDDIDTGTIDPVLYFDYDEIYQKLEEMGLNYEEMKKLCIDMLYETHKRKVLTATNLEFIFISKY